MEKFGSRWVNVPQKELRVRYAEIPADEPLFIICDTGARSYEAQVFLETKGITDTLHIQGGYAMIKVTDPEF
ncbi:rhodanese-like domain-containing protein [Thermodesulfobacteriota bacterium]